MQRKNKLIGIDALRTNVVAYPRKLVNLTEVNLVFIQIKLALCYGKVSSLTDCRL